MGKISRMKEIQQEVVVATWDNVLLGLTLFAIGLSFTMILTGLSNLSTKISPNWLLLILTSFMFLWFIFQPFLLLLDSVFYKERRFTNKSKFIAFVFSFFIFSILFGVLSLLAIIFPEFYIKYINHSFLFYISFIILYGIPTVSWFIIYPKIKKFFLKNCPTLILKGILSSPKQQRRKLYNHWNTTYSKLKELDKKY